MHVLTTSIIGMSSLNSEGITVETHAGSILDLAKSVELTVCWASPGTINTTEQIMGGGQVNRGEESGTLNSLGHKGQMLPDKLNGFYFIFDRIYKTSR